MTNRIKLSEVHAKLAYSNDQVAAIENILVAGNSDYTGEEIWAKLNAAGYVIVPTKLVLDAVDHLEAFTKV